MGISSLAGRTGMFLMATTVVITASACSHTASEAKPVPKTPQQELSDLGFTNPRVNPNADLVKQFPYEADIGKCTFDMTKAGQQPLAGVTAIQDEQGMAVVVVTNASLAKVKTIPPLQVCFDGQST